VHCNKSTRNTEIVCIKQTLTPGSHLGTIAMKRQAMEKHISFGAMDWSGATRMRTDPDAPDCYICALVAVTEVDILSETLHRIRAKFGMADDAEIHAHNLPESIHCAALQEVLALQPYVAAIRYDKRLFRQRQQPAPKPAEFAQVAALTLLRQILPVLPLASLVFDEDIQGKGQQQAFLTAVRQSAHGIAPVRLRTRFVRSRSNDLAQAADLFAHVLLRDAEQRIKLDALKVILHGVYVSERTFLLDQP
jgi:hypothetical protein